MTSTREASASGTRTTSTVSPTDTPALASASGPSRMDEGEGTSPAETRQWVFPTLTTPPPGSPRAVSSVASARAVGSAPALTMNRMART